MFSKMTTLQDFRKFAMSNSGISSMVLDDVIKSQNQYLNPYILEERQLNVTQMDVFSRLMMDRIIFLGTPIDDYTANTLQAQLLYLDSTDPGKDISIYINSPGGSVYAGLGIYDTGYKNAHYATYVSAGVQTFVNNVSVKNAVTGATETPLETIVSSQPDYLYILVGTNNLVVQGSEESFIAYYERLIDMLREQLNPGVSIYIQSIPGVQEDVVQSKPGLDNTRIATANDLLANMALRKGCYFINVREALTNPADGSQYDDYATKDGVHFNAAGYHAWAEYLATHTVWNRRSQYLGQNPYYIYSA